jgi:hypothetical protein
MLTAALYGDKVGVRVFAHHYDLMNFRKKIIQSAN